MLMSALVLPQALELFYGLLFNRHAAVIAFVHAGYELEPAVHFLESAGRVRHWPGKTAAELEALVQEAFIDLGDQGLLVALTDEDEPSDASAIRAAAKCVEEWRLCKWALDENLQKGETPSTSSMLARLAADRMVRGDLDFQAAGTVVEGKARKFMSRLRQRWGGRFGAIREIEHVPLREMQLKATSRTTIVTNLDRHHADGSRGKVPVDGMLVVLVVLGVSVLVSMLMVGLVVVVTVLVV